MTRDLLVGVADPQKLRDAVIRSDLCAMVHKVFATLSPGTPFLTNWHIEAICHQLERVRRGEIKRLIINIAPRSGKSTIVSVAFAAFILGHDPSRRIICASYCEELAAKLARDLLIIMRQLWYLSAFPNTRLESRRSAELDFRTTKGGGRLSVSMGGALTGRGGSLIIVDDPQKGEASTSRAQRVASTERFAHTLITRLDNKKDDAIVLVQHRLHVEDLSGKLAEKGGWTVLNLPAIALHDEIISLGNGRSHHRKAGDVLHPAREPIEVLNQMRADMGSFDFEAQYQQNPLPPQGNIVKAGWLIDYDEVPSAGQVIQSWGFAVREGEDNDWTVCVTAKVHGNTAYLIDVFRKRLDYPRQRQAVIDQARHYDARVILIEKAANGSPLLTDLRHVGGPGIPTPIGIVPKGCAFRPQALRPVICACQSEPLGSMSSVQSCCRSQTDVTTIRSMHSRSFSTSINGNSPFVPSSILEPSRCLWKESHTNPRASANHQNAHPHVRLFEVSDTVVLLAATTPPTTRWRVDHVCHLPRLRPRGKTAGSGAPSTTGRNSS